MVNSCFEQVFQNAVRQLWDCPLVSTFWHAQTGLPNQALTARSKYCSDLAELFQQGDKGHLSRKVLLRSCVCLTFWVVWIPTKTGLWHTPSEYIERSTVQQQSLRFLVLPRLSLACPRASRLAQHIIACTTPTETFSLTKKENSSAATLAHWYSSHADESPGNGRGVFTA